VTALTCAAVEDLAPELALGGLDGPDRAAVLGHLVGCPACQAVIEDLSALADRLLLLTPEDEPSAGFESRALRGVDAARARRAAQKRPGWKFAALAAAVALVVSSSLLVANSRRTTHGPSLTAEYVDALQLLGGRSLRAAALKDAHGNRVGQAFIYDGTPSWVFVSVDHGAVDGEYSVVCTGKAAGPLAWGGLRVSDGHGALGFSADGNVGPLDQIRVVDKAGHAPYSASLEATPT
jgi:hypothetical protein